MSLRPLDVACPSCRAAPGAVCFPIGHPTAPPLRTYFHSARRAVADPGAADRREAAWKERLRARGCRWETEIDIVATEVASEHGVDDHSLIINTEAKPSAEFLRNVIIDRGGDVERSVIFPSKEL